MGVVSAFQKDEYKKNIFHPPGIYFTTKFLIFEIFDSSDVQSTNFFNFKSFQLPILKSACAEFTGLDFFFVIFFQSLTRTYFRVNFQFLTILIFFAQILTAEH